MLELVEIQKSYHIGPVMTPVLHGISLTIHNGDLFSIMGPSGSGKSTLLNLLGLLDTNYTGRYLIDGQDVSGMTDKDLSAFRNRHIGFVFQSFNLLANLTALENVALPMMYRGLPRSAARKRAIDMLQKVSIADRFNHKPDQLSGGQKQRVAIARALVNRPSVILADEPTGALDSDTADEVMSLMNKLNAEEGIAVITITHNRLVHELATRKALLQDGILMEYLE